MKKQMTGHPNVLKEINKGLIKTALQKLQTATRVEISAETKISQPTVNLIINELLNENVVVENGIAKSTGGRKATLYSLNTQLSYVASIVLEEREVQFSITDMNGNEADSDFIETDENWTVERIMDIIGKILRRQKDIKALAVGVPGVVSRQGQVSAIPKIECLEGCPLKEKLEEAFGIKVSVCNDINTTAVGYYSDNVKDNKEFACIHMGNTFGAALIIGGKIVLGSGNFAGEVGLMQIDTNLREKEISVRNKSDEQIILDVSKITVNIISLINPSVLAIGGRKLKDGMLEKIRDNCRKVLPIDMMPEFIRIDKERQYYLEGLSTVGFESINSDIKLVRQTNITE